MYEYEVETTWAIVKEMAHYDEATYQLLSFVRLGLTNPITDEAEAPARCAELFGAENMKIYRWHLTSEHAPAKERWASFGVTVEDA